MATPSHAQVERKSHRLEMRVTSSAKEMIQRASAISGLTAGDLAYQAAREIVEQHDVMHLHGEDARALAEALVNPPEPTDSLVAAIRRRLDLESSSR